MIVYQNDWISRQAGKYHEVPVTKLLAAFPAHLYSAPEDVFPFSYIDVLQNGKTNVQCKIKRHKDGNLIVSVIEGDVQLRQLRDIETKKNAAENLLRSAILGTGTLEQVMAETCRIASAALDVTRVNVWEFGSGLTSITSLANFDNRYTELLPNNTLYRYQIPNYFSLLETEEIIPTADALNHANTAELVNGYLDVNGIRALMDVPVHIGGKMIGVVCFEDTKQIREWNHSEQKFGLFISQVIALAIESSRRKKTQKDLELILDEKRILLNEIHRRVRNNFALIQDLMRAEAGKAHDQYHKDLFSDLRNRVNSLDMLQRQLYQSEKVDRVNFRDLILDLVAGYRATFSGSQTDFITTLDQCELSVAKASISGLFVNEIMMMLMSEAGRDTKVQISIRLKKINTRVHISISSSITIGAKDEKERMLTSFELAEKLGSKLEIDRSKGTGYSLVFEG